MMSLQYPNKKLRNTYYGRYCVIIYCHFKVEYLDVSSLHPPSLYGRKAGSEDSLIKQHYSRNACITYHADRIYL